MHKPPGVDSQRNQVNCSTVYDLFERLVAEDRVPGGPPATPVGAVGRLDRATSGLIILTNDGYWNKRVCESQGFAKRYELTVAGTWFDGDEQIVRLREPLHFQRSWDEVTTMPATVRVLGHWREKMEEGKPAFLGERTALEFELVEGKHRQIRRLCHRSDLTLFRLHRVAVGPVLLGSLPVGEVRLLSEHELMELEELGVLRTDPAAASPRGPFFLSAF